MPPTNLLTPRRRASTSILHDLKTHSSTLSIPAMTAPTDSDRCFMLDMLPPELRLSIYEYLVVSDQPLRGVSARKDHRYNLNLSIFRTNHQIHEEAKSVFFARNAFYVTSIPELDVQPNESGDGTGSRPEPEFKNQFEPPLPPESWPLIRHLTIDLLYYPRKSVAGNAYPMGWKPTDPGCAAYIKALISLLPSLSPKLRSLALTATIHDPFCARKCLISFFMCDRDRTFARALASISHNVKNIPISFEFPDCYYRTNVRKDVFLTKSILLLACQVMFCQSQCRIDELLSQFDGGAVKDAEGGGSEKEKTDLGPYVEQGTWAVGPKGVLDGRAQNLGG